MHTNYVSADFMTVMGCLRGLIVAAQFHLIIHLANRADIMALFLYSGFKYRRKDMAVHIIEIDIAFFILVPMHFCFSILMTL